jgi:hypothetical protein
MKHQKADHDYMTSQINMLFYGRLRKPGKHEIEAYLQRCKQLRDSYNYRPDLARKQAFNEEIL